MATIDDYDSSSDGGDDDNINFDGDLVTVVADVDMDEETDYTVPPVGVYNTDTDVIEGGGEKDNDDDDDDDKAPPNADVKAADDDDDDDDDDIIDLSEKYKKLKGTSHMDILKEAHPESISVNYQEIEALATIVYDEHKNIVDPLHVTMPLLTKYERTRIIGLRAIQLANGAKPFINVENNVINNILIAQEELKQKKLPFIIKRPMPNGGAEYWHLADLEIISPE